MDSTIYIKKLSWTPLCQAAALFIGTFISFMTAYSRGSVSIYLPFFSETGAHSPEVCIFTYTLILGSFFGVIVVLWRYTILKHVLSRENKRLLKFNTASLWCGVLSMALLAGVAAIPMSTVLWAHLMVAGLHFMFAMAFLFLQTYISCYSSGLYSFWSKIRIGFCICLVVFIFGLVILFPLSHREWRKNNTKPPAEKLPEDVGFPLMISSALFEWLLYAIFLLYMISFFTEFRNYHVQITVVPVNEVNL